MYVMFGLRCVSTCYVACIMQPSSPRVCVCVYVCVCVCVCVCDRVCLSVVPVEFQCSIFVQLKMVQNLKQCLLSFSYISCEFARCVC